MNYLIRQFKTRNFTVIVRAVEDYDVDLSFDDDGSVAADINSGKLMCFGVEAMVRLNGARISHDFLGGCIYADPLEFMDHKGIRNFVPPGGKAGQCGSYFSDMVRTVCAEARKAVASLQSIKVRL